MSRWRKTPVRILCAVAVALVAIASQPSDSWAQSKKGAKSQRTVTFEDDVIETTLLRRDLCLQLHQIRERGLVSGLPLTLHLGGDFSEPILAALGRGKDPGLARLRLGDPLGKLSCSAGEIVLEGDCLVP